MKIIAIASSKGGVGKTTAAINLGTAMSKLGLSNIVIDCNLTNPDIGLYLGTGTTPKNIHTIINGKHSLSEGIHLHNSGLKLIPGDINLDAGIDLNINSLFGLKKNLKNMSGIKILDSASGITKESLAPLALADEAIVVTTPELPAIMDTLKTIQSAQKIGTNICGVILNRVRENPSAYAQRVRQMLGKPIIGIIPEDSCITESQKQKNPVVHSHPHSQSSQSYIRIAQNIAFK